jgi:DNA excision repair protein ERCC-2
MRHARERLSSLLNTLEIEKIHEYTSLNIITDFTTLLATYFEGFAIIIEPFAEENRGVAGTTNYKDPLLQFYCLDASIATKPLF